MSSPSRRDLVKSHAFEVKELKREVNVTKERLEACESELAKSAGSNAALENRILEQEAAGNELHSQLKKLKDEKRALVAEVSKISQEADRLNALVHAKSGSVSSSDARSDVVRLHDRVSQYRKEVDGLRKEVVTLNGIIKAKDLVISQSESAVAAAAEANSSKRTDLNVILDLKRQLKEMEERLGGEESQNKLADGENEHYRMVVGRKDEEIEVLMDQIESQRNDVLDARKAQAAADILMAEAAAKMAESVEMSERARKAEAGRVASGGFVTKDVHEAVIADLEACMAVVQAHEKGVRDETLLAYRAALVTADARMRREVAQGLKAKRHLANAIGEYEYTLLFNAPPPSDQQMASVEAWPEDAEEGGSAFEAVLAEKEREILALNDALAHDRAMLVARTAEMKVLQNKMDRMEGERGQATTAGRLPAGSNVEVQKMSVGTSMPSTRSMSSITATAALDAAEESPGKPLGSPEAGASGEPRGTAAPKDIAAASVLVSVAGATTGAFAGNRPPRPVSSEALASIVRSLVASKEAKLQVRYGEEDGDPRVSDEGVQKLVQEGDDEELYQEAIAMLQEELAKLTEQMMSETDVAARIRQQVGDWKTAQLSATQTAELLDSYNQMSMKLAAQTAVMSQRQDAYDRAQLVIADLNMEIRRVKGKSPLRSVKKAFSSTVRGIKQSISSPTPRLVTTVSPLSDSAAVL